MKSRKYSVFDTATTTRGIQNLQFNPDGFPPWLFTKSLNNTSFVTKHNNLNLRNMQLKLVLQMWQQQQRKNLKIQMLNLKNNMLISKDKVKTLLGFIAITRLIQDWEGAEPNEVLSRDCTWDHFLKNLRSYFKPTENPIIRNFEFRQQIKNDTFSTFCNRVKATEKKCTFCEFDSDCSALLRNIRFVTK